MSQNLEDLYMEDEYTNPNYHLSEEQKSFIKQNEIVISCGYLGMLRAYIINGDGRRVIWQTSSWESVLAAWVSNSSFPKPSDPHLSGQLHDWLNEIMALSEENLKERLANSISLF